jgi:hypothetical protein
MRALLTGMGLGLVLMACASFSYKYYALDYQHAMLLGKTPADDLPLSVCQGDAQSATKCMVLTIDEFYRVKSDLEKCQSDLISCQKRCR